MTVTYDVAPVQMFTNGLLTMLKAQLEPGIRVYDTTVPTGATFPYVMLTPLPGGSSYGPALTNPDADLEIPYQIDGVGSRRDQAQFAADRAMQALVGRDPATGAFRVPFDPVTGWNVCDRMRDDEALGGVVPEGAPPSITYTAPQRFKIAVTPE